MSGGTDESGEVAQIDFQHHLSERLGEQGMDAEVPQIQQALVDGIGNPVEQMVDVDVMASQIVEDVVDHADEVEFFLEQFLEKGVDQPVPQIPEAPVGVLETNRVEEESTKDAEHSCQDRNWNASPRPCTVVAFTTAAFPFSSSQQLCWVGTSAKNHLTCLAFSPTDTTKGANDSTQQQWCYQPHTPCSEPTKDAKTLRTQHPAAARDAAVWPPKTTRSGTRRRKRPLLQQRRATCLKFSVLVLDEQQLSQPLTALTAPILQR